MATQDYETNKENMVDFITGSHYCTVSFTNRKHINRMKRLYEQRESEFKYFHENEDGSICASIPLKWLKINGGSAPDSRQKREMSEEEKDALVARLQAGRKK